MADQDDEKDGLDAYLHHARMEVLPRMKASAMSIAILGEPDPKLCMELGAALLYDKPIILVAREGWVIPPTLARIASAIIVGEMGDPDTQERLRQAIDGTLKWDERTRQQ